MEVCGSSERTGDSVPPTLVNLHEINEETARMKNQAVLGNWLRRETVKRCKVQSGTEDTSAGKSRGTGPPIGSRQHSYPKGLLMHEERWVTKLTDVKIFPNVGETGLGTLEAHFNGFIYSTCGFRQVFMHDDVEAYFYRFGIKKEPPVLQFRLKHSVTVGSKKTKDIQFCMVPLPTPLEQVGSDNIRRTRFSNSRNNEFVHRVPETQRTCKIRMPYNSVYFEELGDFEFPGNCPVGVQNGAPAMFCLTYSALVVLEEQPYYVVPLFDIKIVNLALIRPDRIEMTVVFKDLERDVLEIGAVPLGYLSGIKYWLDRANVKYYVNSLSPNWRELVSEVRERPEMFIAEGGWDVFEDSLTLSCYQHVHLDMLSAWEDVYF